jgi:uncharacterized SAM-binding protein YcdF (DUF218 family)
MFFVLTNAMQLFRKKYENMRIISAISTVVVIVLTFGLYKPTKVFLTSYLSTTDTLPDNSCDALYILGGSPRSTYKHLITASELYKRKMTSCILLFKKNSKTEYDPILHRNLTNNEWEIRYLKKWGVPDSAIKTVPVHEKFFGTLSEAQDLSSYFIGNKYKSVILVSSPCHSRRLSNCFRHYLKSSGIKISVQGSDDPFYMRELIFETIKVQVYKAVMVFTKKS